MAKEKTKRCETCVFGPEATNECFFMGEVLPDMVACHEYTKLPVRAFDEGETITTSDGDYGEILDWKYNPQHRMWYYTFINGVEWFGWTPESIIHPD